MKNIYLILDNDFAGDIISVFCAYDDAQAQRSFYAIHEGNKKLNLLLVKVGCLDKASVELDEKDVDCLALIYDNEENKKCVVNISESIIANSEEAETYNKKTIKKEVKSKT